MDFFLKLIDRLVVGYLAYRAGKAKASNENYEALIELMNRAKFFKQEVKKQSIKDRIDERYN